MTRNLITMLMLGIFLYACSESQPQEPLQFDVVIENGRVLDGLGGAAFEADVFVRDGEIVLIDDLEALSRNNAVQADQRIDAAGRIVAPGFIDVHSHGDPLQTPAFENLLTPVKSTNLTYSSHAFIMV